jgi:hypothetical protein
MGKSTSLPQDDGLRFCSPLTQDLQTVDAGTSPILMDNAESSYALIGKAHVALRSGALTQPLNPLACSSGIRLSMLTSLLACSAARDDKNRFGRRNGKGSTRTVPRQTNQ